jgi:hypothetical protein
MKKTSLRKTNPYLAKKIRPEAALSRSVVSSTAIEGVHVRLDKARATNGRASRATSAAKRK